MGRSHVHTILECVVALVKHTAILLAFLRRLTFERGAAVLVAITLQVVASVACFLTDRLRGALAEIAEIHLQQLVTFFCIGTCETEIHIKRIDI